VQSLPGYPPELQSAGHEGLLSVYVTVTEEGRIDPERLILLDCLHPVFAREPVITIVKSWRFEPGSREGIPVAALARIEVDFRLRKR